MTTPSSSRRQSDDPVARARDLSEVFDEVMAAGGPSLRVGHDGPAPRPIISQSWERSLAAHVDPEKLTTPPVVYSSDDLPTLRADHPLNSVMPLLRSTLVSIADEAMHVMLVTDAEGHILWRDGASKLLTDADRAGLYPGTQVSEEKVGTNAMGTTLAVDAPVQIHSAEHLVRAFHTWTCVAAPVHDPDTGAILGAVDISGPLRSAHPALVQLVATTATLAENQLRVRVAIADERLRMRNMPHLASLRGTAGALVTPTGRIIAGEPYGRWPERVVIGEGADRVMLADGREMLVEPLAEGYLLRAATPSTRRAPRTALSMRFMRDGSPRLLHNGRPVPLTLRPAEVLTVLALHPDGVSGERLAQLLYGDDGNPTTVRGEIHRLRALIGSDVLRTRPYRLDATVDSDFGSVRAALQAGRVEAALSACGGSLLPRSDAPEIRDLRDELEAGLRRAVLDTDDPELLHTFAGHPLGHDDLEVHDRLITLLPPGDTRLAAVAMRRARLLRD